MPTSTTALEILSQLVFEQPRTWLDLLRTLQCPSHEKWVFFNSRNSSQYVVRTDQRPRPWPGYWIHDSLRKVRLDPVALNLVLEKDYETPNLKRVRDLNVKAQAEVQIRDDADAARKCLATLWHIGDLRPRCGVVSSDFPALGGVRVAGESGKVPSDSNGDFSCRVCHTCQSGGLQS